MFPWLLETWPVGITELRGTAGLWGYRHDAFAAVMLMLKRCSSRRGGAGGGPGGGDAQD